MASANRDRIRTGFLIFFVYLLIQYGLVGILGAVYSEPWPAFTLPGFKNVFDRGEFIEQRVPEFVAESGNATMYHLKPAQIFHDIPVSHHNGIMRNQFNPERRPSRESIRQLNPEGYAWLQDRIRKETNETEIRRIMVVWSWHRYQIRGEDMNQMSVEPYDTLHVVLSPAKIQEQ